MINLNREVLSANLNEMILDDVKPLDKPWVMVTAEIGDKARMTMQGLGNKELYVIEIIRKYWES